MSEGPSRDDRLMDHLGLYRISLRPIVERLFFDGKNSGNVIQRLLNQKRIQSRSGLPRRMRYYQLSAAEAKTRGFPVGRTEPFGSQALNTHLGVLWFCCAGETRRHLVEPDDLQRQFGEGLPSGPHAVEQDYAMHRLWRLRVAAAEAEDNSLIRWLRKEMAALSRHSQLATPLRTRQYAFMLLVDTKTRVPALEQSILEAGLTEDALIQVEFAPSHLTLAEAVKQL